MEKEETMPSLIHNNLEQQTVYNCKTVRQINAFFYFLNKYGKHVNQLKGNSLTYLAYRQNIFTSIRTNLNLTKVYRYLLAFYETDRLQI